eukprot:scaffold37289_cov22-Tisochrysis_lutea.AAC.1
MRKYGSSILLDQTSFGSRFITGCSFSMHAGTSLDAISIDICASAGSTANEDDEFFDPESSEGGDESSRQEDHSLQQFRKTGYLGPRHGVLPLQRESKEGGG